MTTAEELDDTDEEIQDEGGDWSPKLFPRQVDVIENETPIMLVSGPRYSGKSIALANKAVMRAWEIWDANIAIVVSSYKVATGGGSWADIVGSAHEWHRAGITSEYGHQFAITSIDPETGNPGSKLDKANRTPLLTIRNKFGGESNIRLISIDNENEIEQKTRSGRFQWIWIVELSNFTSRSIITEYYLILRHAIGSQQSNPKSHLYWPSERFQLVADTNPAEDGKNNWIYRWFYAHDASGVLEKDRTVFLAFKSKMDVEEIFLEDNTFLPAGKHAELIGLFGGDPIPYMRFVEGKWPDGSMEKSYMFGDVFTDDLIVEGKIEVDELTELLYTSQDLGPQNKAFVLLERRIVEGISVWCVLEELGFIGEYVSTEDFARMELTVLIEQNEFYKERRKNFRGFDFEHWSDSSSWNQNLNDESGTEALEISNATNGQIEIRPADKPAKSVEVGCQLIRKLMREKRLFIGQNCLRLIKSLRNIKRSSKAGKTLDPGDPLKHFVDALRYCLFMVEGQEMANGPIKSKLKNNRRMSVPW